METYLSLRLSAGLSTRTVSQATAAIRGSYCAVHIKHLPSASIVAMGRVIGDGGWYFYLSDMAVVPEHQRKGLGSLVLQRLLENIREGLIAEEIHGQAYIGCIAHGPGRALYRRFGFVETAPRTVSMGLKIEGRGVSDQDAPLAHG